MPSRRILVISVTVLGVGLAFWSLWPFSQPSVQLPDGVSLAQVLANGKNQPPMGWHTNRYCLGGLPPVYLDARERTKLVLERMRYEAHELAGQNLHKVPNPPDVDYVTPRLGECYDTSGEKYLYAKELGCENGFSLLGFVWGGTNQVRHAQDRITLIEDGKTAYSEYA